MPYFLCSSVSLFLCRASNSACIQTMDNDIVQNTKSAGDSNPEELTDINLSLSVQTNLLFACKDKLFAKAEFRRAELRLYYYKSEREFTNCGRWAMTFPLRRQCSMIAALNHWPPTQYEAWPFRRQRYRSTKSHCNLRIQQTEEASRIWAAAILARIIKASVAWYINLTRKLAPYV